VAHLAVGFAVEAYFQHMEIVVAALAVAVHMMRVVAVQKVMTLIVLELAVNWRKTDF
jgi:hypothetical protein